MPAKRRCCASSSSIRRSESSARSGCATGGVSTVGWSWCERDPWRSWLVSSFPPWARTSSLNSGEPATNAGAKNRFYRHPERTLDLSFVREFVQETYSSGGRLSVDPKIFFKLQLVMFFEGIRSERQLMRHTALGDTAISKRLHAMGFSLRANKKTIEGSSHADRDAQFEHIKQQCEQFEAAGDPIIKEEHMPIHFERHQKIAIRRPELLRQWKI